jgi:mutator protein MutT
MPAKKFQVLVGAIPVAQGKVLVLQRSMAETFMPGAWGIPCGKIEFGEDLEDAVLRELKEEAGISGSVGGIVGYSEFLSSMNLDALHNIQINFVVHVPRDERVVLDHSNQDFRWIALEDCPTADLDDFTLRTISQARELLGAGSQGNR